MATNARPCTPIPREILERVIAQHDTEHDAATLACIAQCCKAAYDLAAPALYDDIHVCSDRQMYALLSDLCLGANTYAHSDTLTPLAMAKIEPKRWGRCLVARKLALLRQTMRGTIHYNPDRLGVAEFERAAPLYLCLRDVKFIKIIFLETTPAAPHLTSP